MSNEPSPAVCQYTNNKVCIQNGSTIYNIPEMVKTENTQEKNLYFGCGSNNLPNNQNSNNDCLIESNNNYFNNAFTFEIKKSSTLIEEEIDKISLSSDEDIKDMEEEKLNKDVYVKESNKINEFYNNEENDESMNKYFGTKNELSDVKVIPTVFHIEDNFNFLSAGIVINKSIEGKFLINADSTNGVLDLDNIMFSQNKLPVGYIDDVLGKIDTPLYIIKILPNYTGNTNLQGEKLYFVKEKAKYVNKNDLVSLKGSDASNAFDEEIDENERDFSDDEEERSKKEKAKKLNINKNPNNNYKSSNNFTINQNHYMNKYMQNNSNKNCQEYKINHNNYSYANTNVLNNPYNNNFTQQQYFQNMTIFNPNSMFSQYSNSTMNNQVNNQNGNQVNSPFFQQINPFIHNNFNKIEK